MSRYLPLLLGQVQVGQAVVAVQHGFDPELLMNSICPMLENLVPNAYTWLWKYRSTYIN